MFLLLITVLCLEVWTVNGQAMGCNHEYIISRNTSITPPELITASDSLQSPAAPPAYVLNFGYNGDDFFSWCTDTNDPNPYIIIRFSTPVIITSFLSSGSTDFSFSELHTYHVTNFTLEFTYNSSDSFRYYTANANVDRQYFYMAQPLELFNLEKPITAERIRLTPIEWYDSETSFYQYICLGVALFGCTASEASQSQTTTPPSETTMTASTGTTTGADTSQQPTTTMGVPEQPTAVQFIVVKDYQALEIVLPIALIVILIVAAIVALGVVLCVKVKRGKSHSSRYTRELLETSQTPLSPGIKILDNSALYGIPSTQDYHDGTIRHVSNDLYGEDTGTNGQVVTNNDTESLEVIYSDATYEYITTSPDVNESQSHKQAHRDSLEDNSAYNDVFVDMLDESEKQEAEVKKETFRLVRNDSYESTLYGEEGDQKSSPIENIYEETIQ